MNNVLAWSMNLTEDMFDTACSMIMSGRTLAPAAFILHMKNMEIFRLIPAWTTTEEMALFPGKMKKVCDSTNPDAVVVMADFWMKTMPGDTTDEDINALYRQHCSVKNMPKSVPVLAAFLSMSDGGFYVLRGKIKNIQNHRYVESKEWRSQTNMSSPFLPWRTGKSNR